MGPNAAAKRQVRSELPLERSDVHGLGLDWVQGVQADVDQVADDRQDVAAAMMENGPAVLPGQGIDFRQERLDEPSPMAGRHEHASLRPVVVAECHGAGLHELPQLGQLFAFAILAAEKLRFQSDAMVIGALVSATAITSFSIAAISAIPEYIYVALTE